jgi:uncharacterized membrane protein
MIDLIIIAIFSAALVPLVGFTSGALRIALGLVFILFSPGYSLIAALFPKRSALSGIERVALSFGLSIAVVPLIGLSLNYMPWWGIRLYPILISLLVFIVAMTAVAWYRRRRLDSEERFQFELRSRLYSIGRSWAGQGRWDRILTALMVLAVLGALGSLGYMIAKPKLGESFTQFYLLGLEGKAEGYPRQIVVGENASVVLGIANHEHQSTSYRIEIAIDGQKVATLGPITLAHEEEWEETVSFSPARVGLHQKVEFWLYKDEGEDAYLKTHLWVDVNAEGEAP